MELPDHDNFIKWLNWFKEKKIYKVWLCLPILFFCIIIYQYCVISKKNQTIKTTEEKIAPIKDLYPKLELSGAVSKLISDYDNISETLKKQKDKTEKLRWMAEKDIYKPLTEDIKTQLTQRLKTAKEKNIKKVLISSFDTNNNGKRVIGDLLELFKTVGIDASVARTGMSFGKGVSLYKVKINQATVEAAEYLCNILAGYLKTKYSVKIDSKLEDGVIDIEFNGIPLFHEDGSVEFQ
jgi:hypothetical protein